MTEDALDAFARLVAGRNVQLNVQPDALPDARRPAKVDALFHLPLLALCILVIAKLRVVSAGEMGRRVARVLSEHFRALGDVDTLEWSITLRRRCAEALTLLEAARLVEVNDGDSRTVIVTELGRTLMTTGLRDEGDVGQLVRGLVRAGARSALRAEAT